MPDSFYHSARFTNHTEKLFFLGKFKNGYYDAVIMNGSIVAHSSKATSTFILKLKKHFIIDPMTHAFQHDIKYLKNDSGKVKQSLVSLSNAYGDPVKSLIEEEESVDATSFNKQNTKDFVEKVLRFQLELLPQIVNTGPFSDYINYALKDKRNDLSRDHIKPSLLIAPYLYIENVKDIDVNENFISSSEELIEQESFGKELATQLVISAEAFQSKDMRDKILAIYKETTTSRVFLWIDGFKEEEVSVDELEDLKSFVESLSTNGKKVVSLYGGYFSLLLTKARHGFVGVCHGMEHGESRSVVPVGGGVSRAMYYFPPFHKRLRRADTARIFKRNQFDEEKGSQDPNFAKKVCSCDYCKDIPTMFEETKKGYSTGNAKRQTLGHYLENKKQEYDYVKRSSLPKLLKLLNDAHQEFKETTFPEDIAHLQRWKNVMEEKKNLLEVKSKDTKVEIKKVVL